MGGEGELTCPVQRGEVAKVRGRMAKVVRVEAATASGELAVKGGQEVARERVLPVGGSVGGSLGRRSQCSRFHRCMRCTRSQGLHRHRDHRCWWCKCRRRCEEAARRARGTRAVGTKAAGPAA